MDPTQLREILEVTTKLESSFRHIKFLCGKYMELQSGINRFPPYGEYSHPLIGYMPPLNNYAENHYYPPTNFKVEHQIQQNHPIQQKTPKPSYTNQVTKLQTTKPIQKQQKIQSMNSKQQNSSMNKNNIKIGNILESPFSVFFHKKKGQIKRDYPNLQDEQLAEIMLQVWNSFGNGQKQAYEAEWRKLKMKMQQKKAEIKKNIRPTINETAKMIKK